MVGVFITRVMSPSVGSMATTRPKIALTWSGAWSRVVLASPFVAKGPVTPSPSPFCNNPMRNRLSAVTECDYVADVVLVLRDTIPVIRAAGYTRNEPADSQVGQLISIGGPRKDGGAPAIGGASREVRLELGQQLALVRGAATSLDANGYPLRR